MTQTKTSNHKQSVAWLLVTWSRKPSHQDMVLTWLAQSVLLPAYEGVNEDLVMMISIWPFGGWHTYVVVSNCSCFILILFVHLCVFSVKGIRQKGNPKWVISTLTECWYSKQQFCTGQLKLIGEWCVFVHLTYITKRLPLWGLNCWHNLKEATVARFQLQSELHKY